MIGTNGALAGRGCALGMDWRLFSDPLGELLVVSDFEAQRGGRVVIGV